VLWLFIQDNPRQSRCLGVFGLSLYTQERDLREVFEQYGPIEDLQIVYDHQSGRSRGFAFIYMRNYEDAVEVCSFLCHKSPEEMQYIDCKCYKHITLTVVFPSRCCL